MCESLRAKRVRVVILLPALRRDARLLLALLLVFVNHARLVKDSITAVQIVMISRVVTHIGTRRSFRHPAEVNFVLILSNRG